MGIRGGRKEILKYGPNLINFRHGVNLKKVTKRNISFSKLASNQFFSILELLNFPFSLLLATTNYIVTLKFVKKKKKIPPCDICKLNTTTTKRNEKNFNRIFRISTDRTRVKKKERKKNTHTHTAGYIEFWTRTFFSKRLRGTRMNAIGECK